MISQCNVCGAVFSPKKGKPTLSSKDRLVYGCRICGTHWWKRYEYLKKWVLLDDHKGYGGIKKYKNMDRWGKTWSKNDD